MGAPKIGHGHYIREWRLFSDMTLEQLGDRINLTHATLSRIERGKTAYTQQVLERLAEVLSCQPADLICRDPDPLAQYRRKQEPKVSEKKNRTIFIREWRRFRKLSQSKLGFRMGISREYVSLVENGKRRYDQVFLEAAAEALNCSIADLITRDPTKPEPIWSVWDKIKLEDREQALRVLSAFSDKK